MQRLPSIRASDADREQAAGRLRHATGEGRLSPQELEERLEALFASRTYGELDALLADLPAPTEPPVRVARWAGAAGAVALLFALLSTLAVLRARALGAVMAARARQARIPGAFVDPHHAVVAAASTVVVFAVLLASAALAWAFMRSRPSSDA